MWRNPGEAASTIGCRRLRVHAALLPFLSFITDNLLLRILPSPLAAIAQENNNPYDGSRRRSAGPCGHALTA